MTFDEVLDSYHKARTATREALSEVHKLENQYVAFAKDLANAKRRYNSVRKGLTRAQDMLIPELKKEVVAHQLMEPFEKPAEVPKTEADEIILEPSPLSMLNEGQ